MNLEGILRINMVEPVYQMYIDDLPPPFTYVQSVGK